PMIVLPMIPSFRFSRISALKGVAHVGDSEAFEQPAPLAEEHRNDTRRGSCHQPVLEVRDAGRLDGPDLLELHLRVLEVVEEAGTVAEQYWNDVELKLVQQSRCEVLVSDLGA